MFLSKPTNRYQAFTIHLAISLVIFLILLGLIVFSWYPGVFINMGGVHGIKIVAGVDLVLGPLLTLIVFDQKKKSLVFDLAVIALIQVSALAAGTYFVHQERPVVQIVADDGLHILTISDFKLFDKPLKPLGDIDDSLPAKIYLNQPKTDAEIALTKSIAGFFGEPIVYSQNLYIPLDKAHQDGLNERLERFTFDETLNCYWMPTISAHYHGDSCVSIKHGAIKLKNNSSV
ncbi:MAG: hypothetical protein K6L76_09340 [Agarilytica sp.]